nr:GrpB family protein [Actinomycetospora sp. NBRC 106378]
MAPTTARGGGPCGNLWTTRRWRSSWSVARAVDLHCCPRDHVEVRKYLAFRDRLRAVPEERALYEFAKRALADREWADMNYYAEAKSPVIAAILGRAGWPADGA